MENNAINQLQEELLSLHYRYCSCREWREEHFVIVDEKRNEDLLELRSKVISALENKILNKERELTSLMSVFKVTYWLRFRGPVHFIKVNCEQLIRISSHANEIESGSEMDLQNPKWDHVFKEVKQILYTCHHSFLISKITKVSNSLPVRIYDNNWKNKIEVKAIESGTNDRRRLIVFDDMFPVSCNANS